MIISHCIQCFDTSPLARWAQAKPWELTSRSEEVVRTLLSELRSSEFSIANEVAIHRTAVVEAGAILKGPLLIGPDCFIAAGAYLRGGCWLERQCTLGPGSELKSSFVFRGSKLAHFNFVGDSILGEGVNLEAGSIICNYRNERAEKEIRVRVGRELQGIACTKFGALVGDQARIEANAVVAPGAILLPNAKVSRLQLCDQELLNE